MHRFLENMVLKENSMAAEVLQNLLRQVLLLQKIMGFTDNFIRIIDRTYLQNSDILFMTISIFMFEGKKSNFIILIYLIQ